MKKNLMVLTDLSPAAQQAQTYAAELAQEMGAVVHLVHVYHMLPSTTRIGRVQRSSRALAQEVRQQQQSLKQVAAAMAVPATAITLTDLWDDAVRFALEKYRPLLVVTGLTAAGGTLNQWLSNRTLPLAQQSGYPVLLVPAQLPEATLRAPRRIALAVRDHALSLTPQSVALVSQLLASRSSVVPLTVVPPSDPEGGEKSLRAAQACGLVAATPAPHLHRVVAEDSAKGILQGVEELSADVLVMLDPGHGWVLKLFAGSVVDEVTRAAPVPVLLLATQEAA